MDVERLYTALEIFQKYDAHGSLSAEHDEIFVGSTPPSDMTTEEVESLDLLGFGWDIILECWSAYV